MADVSGRQALGIDDANELIGAFQQLSYGDDMNRGHLNDECTKTALLVLVLLASSACGDDALPIFDAGVVDSGTPDSSIDASIFPAIAAPASPRWTSCPTGWQRRGERCAPVSMDRSLPTCGDGEALFASTGPECVRVGPACPEGDFAEPPDDGREVIYVRPNSPRGNGSFERPFRALISAQSAAPEEGAVILLSKGEHVVDTAALRPNIEIIGACTRLTRVSRPEGASMLVLSSTGTNVRISNLTVADSLHAGIGCVQAGDELVLENVIVERVAGFGVIVNDGGKIEATSLVIRDMRPQAGRLFGYAIIANGAAEGPAITVEQLSLRGAIQAAIVLREGLIVASDVFIDDTQPDAMDLRLAANIGRGGQLEMRGLFSIDAVFQVLAPGSRLSVEDAYMRHGIVGVGLGAEAELRRAQIIDADGAGVVIGDPSSALHVEDVWIDGGNPGLLALSGATVELDRVQISNVMHSAIALVGATTTMSARDVRIEDIREDAEGLAGSGVIVENATLSLSRVEMIGVEHAGLSGYEGASVEADDLAIRMTRPSTDTVEGWGLVARTGTTLTLTNALIAGAHEAGVQVRDEGSRVVGRNIRIQDTADRACEGAACAEGSAGMGLGVYDGGAVDFDRFEIDSSAFCGLHMAFAGDVFLRNGRVASNVIGACIHDEGFPLERITEGVAYEGNELNIDTVGPPPLPGIPGGAPSR